MNILEVLSALAVAFLCADVEAYVKEVVTFTGNITGLDEVLYKVGCGGDPCTILRINADKSGTRGSLFLDAKLKSFSCYHSLSPGFYHNNCNRKIKISKNEFFIHLYPQPKFTVVKFTVELENNAISVQKLNALGARVLLNQATGKKYVEITSGIQKSKFPDIMDQYVVECNGPCKNLQYTLQSEKSGKVVLVAAEGNPAFLKKGGCFNCFCKSDNKLPSLAGKCISNGNKKEFSLNSNRVYIYLLPNTESTDVVAYLTGDNIQGVNNYYVFKNRGWYGYLSEDGSDAAARPIIGPHTKGKYINLKVYCKIGQECKDVKIEVKTDQVVKNIRAGKNTHKDANGVCNDCDCLNESECGQKFQPNHIDFAIPYRGTYKGFYITLDLSPGQQVFLAYVKVSGKNVHGVYPTAAKNALKDGVPNL